MVPKKDLFAFIGLEVDKKSFASFGTVSLFGWSFVFEFDQTGNDFDAGIGRFHTAKTLETLFEHAHEVLYAV